MELYVELLLLNNCRDVNLNLQEEHVVTLDRLANLEEVFLAATVVVIDQETSWIPIVLCPIEDLELDEGNLTCLHGRCVLILTAVLLLRDMLNSGQILQ